MPLSQKNYLIVLIVIAFLVAGFFSLFFWDQELLGDGLHYSNLANSLVEDRTFSDNGQLNSRRDPGYPFFLAAIYTIFGPNVNVVYTIQILLFVGICLVSYFLAKAIFQKELLARLTAIIVALYYPLAMHAGMVFTEILFTLLLLGFVHLLVSSLKTDKLWMYGIAGLILGMATLTRSVTLYLPIFLIVVILVVGRKKLKQSLLGGLVFILVFGAVVAPWMIRNKKHFDEFAISTQSGPTIFFAVQRLRIKDSDLPKVFVANILGDYFAQKMFGEYNRFEIEEGDYGQKLTELDNFGLSQQEINDEVGRIAMNEIKDAPLRYLLVVPPIEFLKMHAPIFPFNSVQGLFSDPSKYQNLPEAVKALIILGVRLAYWVFFGIVIYAIIQSRRSWRELIPIYTILVYMIAVYSALHGIPRYALPIYPFYIMFFSFGILYLLNQRNLTK
ncbi:MAG: hypothetical protein COT91_00375 [Candidatus Doudnabacteria bacterium CG10_big_fil_rev_8_21_14_0_10_41_10]|uniref:Glycosyltransferase RgtA/B/C/D-like domain-containing protein n=1 Tax=Candidatus Doudnabacteria bacterium CG10_big_fil_rev_8_21_14_0_10_41_10 TaxID=1974551 RepID=A0A2H0VET9_9BACT|nr:MAG: hypothetical protein COT91_00375 [Candidatus Doudnabacteria bacterium CG10_big_fil_rev_8_21_14_0_10_41_10]